MSEQAETPTISRRFESIFVWCFGIIVGVLGINLYLSEIVIYDKPGLGYHSWWHGPYLVYAIVGILWCFVLGGFYFYIQNEIHDSLGKLTALLAFLSGIIWTSHLILYIVALDYGSLALSYIIWCAGTSTLGVSMILSGFFYAQNFSGTSRILLPIVVISSLATGAFGVIVGFIAGFTLFPTFTVFDIPLVSGVITIPCIMATLFHIQNK